MTKIKSVQFSDEIYALLWSAIVKTGDAESLNLFKSVLHAWGNGDTPNVIEKELLFGFLDEIREKKIECDINKILHGCKRFN